MILPRSWYYKWTCAMPQGWVVVVVIIIVVAISYKK